MTNPRMSQALTFIASYRELEIGPPQRMADNLSRISEFEPTQGIDHLLHTWQLMDRDFGFFYLYLPDTIRYCLLCSFGLESRERRQYCKKIQSSSIFHDILMTHAGIVWSVVLLSFFNTHDIRRQPVNGITLDCLPITTRCYGSSSNWADYILSLNESKQFQILNQIFRKI